MEDNRIPAHERKQEFLDALAQGQKIQAIKIYREMTGSGLKEAKDAVEKLAAELAEKYPGQFPKPSQSGCGTTALVLVLVVSATALAVVFVF